jgi:flavin reductase (DIM6/NTAB) family NADH-FMN oxidoreductase RutF
MSFKKINPEAITGNIVKMIGHEWMLVTAGNPGNFNTMTAAWGGLGYLWNEPLAIIFIRPQRYTYEFTEKHDFFSLCFFQREHSNILKFCGTRSGRDTDKVAATGLTPVASEAGTVYFEEAKLVIECRKVYYHDINPSNFLDDRIKKIYPGQDYHRMYFGFIINCLKMDE